MSDSKHALPDKAKKKKIKDQQNDFDCEYISFLRKNKEKTKSYKNR